jgi:DNA-binding NarL/FixJ family response regulator
VSGGPAERPLRVVIADDHVPTRAGVRLALEGEGFTVVGDAGDAMGAVELTLREEPDLCLFDIGMPGDGIEAARAVTEALPHTRVVMLTVSRSDADLFAALKAGASGYVLKDTDPTLLPGLLRNILAGEAALPQTMLARLVDEFRAREDGSMRPLVRPRDTDLTSREWEVLDCLRDGLTTAETAKRLFISETTVRRHVSSILRKLRVPDREAALRLLRTVQEI